MRLRCFLCRYGDGSESLRWFEDRGEEWSQQVMVYRVGRNTIEYTGDDPTAVSFLEGFKELVEAGKAEEL